MKGGNNLKLKDRITANKSILISAAAVIAAAALAAVLAIGINAGKTPSAVSSEQPVQKPYEKSGFYMDTFI